MKPINPHRIQLCGCFWAEVCGKVAAFCGKNGLTWGILSAIRKTDGCSIPAVAIEIGVIDDLKYLSSLKGCGSTP